MGAKIRAIHDVNASRGLAARFGLPSTAVAMASLMAASTAPLRPTTGMTSQPLRAGRKAAASSARSASGIADRISIALACDAPSNAPNSTARQDLPLQIGSDHV